VLQVWLTLLPLDVLPSPQFHLYAMIAPPGKGSLLPAAENECATPCVTVPELEIVAVGLIGLKTVSPVGVPTPETPS
jgi:hypothetical protein